MSETETGPQPGGESPEAAATETEAPAPVETGAATETETTTEEQPKPSRADRRFAAMSARLAAQSAEIEALRRSATRPPPAASGALPQTPEELQAVVREEAAKLASEERLKDRVMAFHKAGAAAHSDWADRCNNLQAMGADAQMSHILIEMDDGARVAGALADDPEELERIAAIRTERGRAIALGKFAASLPAARPARTPVSRAPAPLRPVNGVANPAFNEFTATPEQLVEFYSKQAMDRRRAH